MVVDYAGHPFQAQLSRAMASRGLQIAHVYAGRVAGPKGLLETLESDDRLSFKSLGRRAQIKTSAASRVRASIDFGAELRREIREWAPDVVLAANVPPEGLLRAGFGSGEPRWVWWVQDLFTMGATGTLKRMSPFVALVAEHFYRRAEAHLSESADAIVLITDAFLRELPEGAHQKASVIHNWAPLGELPQADRDNAWARENDLVDGFNLIYTGTLALKHSPSMLVDLAEGLAHVPSARVVLVSEGPGADQVKEAVDRLGLRNLVALPYQPYERLPEVMGAADALLVLLEREAAQAAVPSKVLSYLCAGRPIIGAMPRSNLATEIVRRSGAGVVVEPGDSPGFVKAAFALLEDPSRASEQGVSGRCYAEREFDIASICDRFLRIMNVAS